MNNEKNIYVEARKQSNLTQAKASEAMKTISEDRLARLETDKISMTPNDVLEMSNAYKRPDLCNYYCTHECPIGKSTLSEIKPQQFPGDQRRKQTAGCSDTVSRHWHEQQYAYQRSDGNRNADCAAGQFSKPHFQTAGLGRL